MLGVAALIVFVPNTGHTTSTPIDTTKAAKVFVPSAMTRQRLATSWPLATREMRQGTSRADWLAGDLPVVPYPKDAYRTFGLTLKYQYKGILGYDVLVLPTENAVGAHAGQQVYSCELHDVRGSWLVNFCYPRKTL